MTVDIDAAVGLTAETITDEDITQLFESLPPGHPYVAACIDAVYAPRGDPRRQRARQQCAELFNLLATTERKGEAK